MTNAITKISESLKAVFAPMDVEVLAASQQWAKARVSAIAAFKASDEYQALRHNQNRLYAQLFAIAGGKTWYKAFDGRNATMIEEFVEKNCKATAESRNAVIVRKLVKAGVTEVISETYTRTADGFNGNFAVMTDKGEKFVRVNTIRAGGYNIQCLHLRVLVTVK